MAKINSKVKIGSKFKTPFSYLGLILTRSSGGFGGVTLRGPFDGDVGGNDISCFGDGDAFLLRLDER